MLAGVKFLSREDIDMAEDVELDDSKRERRKSSIKKKKDQRKKSSSHYSSSDDEKLEKIRKESRKKRWYSSDEHPSSYSTIDESNDRFSEGEKLHKGKNKKKRRKHSYEEHSSYSSDSAGYHRSGGGKQGHIKDDGEDACDVRDVDIVRREIGLEWMTKSIDKADKSTSLNFGKQSEEPPIEEVKKGNSKELNPYLNNNGSGYPEDEDHIMNGRGELFSSSLVGDGGASWRLKALKRAKEQASREGRSLDKVVEERWGPLGHLAASVASQKAAPSHAHLHSIRSRKMGLTEEHESNSNNQNKRDVGKNIGRDYYKDTSSRHLQMRTPKIHDSLSWGKRNGQNMPNRDAELISSAVSSLNKFANDGSFMHKVVSMQNKATGDSNDDPDTNAKGTVNSELDLPEKNTSDADWHLSANHLAAKALQLRMKGKHEEAEKLLKEEENAKSEEVGERLSRFRAESSSNRYATKSMNMLRKKGEDDSDEHLAQRIMKNKQYSISGQADDEYDYDVGQSKRSRKKGVRDDKTLVAKQNFTKRIITQQERCQYCFENPNRPKHLVVAIANFTYLMLPQRQPVVPGHCCILPLQHESATRTVDDNVWEEIRNFKKCLIMMFAKQEKEMVFIETVVGLAQQRRHCLIECIPLPQETAKQAPLYFKKAIDEAEEEWSQHNAKKLIDTTEKGLRASIPKNFPYFHVEFGLSRGFVHVIDDETQFKSSLGLNVIRGMLQLPEEDMYRRRRYDSEAAQKQAVASFARDWDPFDWTKQLE
ncbi:hypothetical protein Nepgr_020691 [Nepenthes gracilis]|uniref:CWF19-like protein 2 n=1 Tax=Nepenthes gracilis TaxID=150966 RepID=A0AAD3SXB2_NEPGR|nr:hypothetical protein Nepgr_020691 [Nepenthes gracilis]